MSESFFYVPSKSQLRKSPPGLKKIEKSGFEFSQNSLNTFSPLLGSTMESLSSLESCISFHESSPKHIEGSTLSSNSGVYQLDINSLAEFKTKLCAIKAKHNQKQCPFYHNNKDHKRRSEDYSMEICPSIEAGDQCKLGDDCTFSHNRVEQLYREENYKMKFCAHYPGNLDKCDYGPFCSFAHEENEIRIQLIHKIPRDEKFFMMIYKTVMCPYNTTQHDRSKCVYAHNWQDYRRRPDIVKYRPVECKNWSKDLFIVKYEQGCSNGLNCEACHGWKELEYHPLLYKVIPCEHQFNCNRKTFCTGYHSEKERRILNNLGKSADTQSKICLRNNLTKLSLFSNYQDRECKSAEGLSHNKSRKSVSLKPSLWESSRKSNIPSNENEENDYNSAVNSKRLDVFLNITASSKSEF